MKISRKAKIVLLSIVGLIAIRYVFFRGTSEAQMREHFKTHKSEFEELRSMFQKDKKIADIGSAWLHRVDPYGMYASDDVTPEEVGITKQRLAHYRSLMDKLGVGVGRQWRPSGDYFQFTAFGGGWTDTTWGVGYVWSSETPENVVPDAYNPGTKNIAHSRIEGNWYIYYRR